MWVPYHIKNRTVSLALEELEQAFAGESDPKARLFSAEGRELERPWQTILGSVSGYEALDHDLTLSPDQARNLGLPASWTRLQSDPDQPTFARLSSAGELVHLFSVLQNELDRAALLACDPAFRVVAVTSAAENLLSFAGGDTLVDQELGPLLDLPSLPTDRHRLEYELAVPINRREKIPLRAQLEPHVDSGGRASGWLVRLSSRPYGVSTVDWRSLIEQFPGVILRLNEQGEILFSNRRVGNILIEDLMGQSVFDLIPEEYQMTAQQFRHSLVNERKVLSGELPIIDTLNGEQIWFRLSAAPVLSGEEIEMLVYATDISLKKQAAEELRASRRHIRSLASELDRAQEEERRRISRQLHDELGGLLTALRLELAAFERSAELNPVATEKLDGVDQLLGETMSTVRRLSTELRPPILDDLGLKAALRSLLTEAGKRCGFKTKLGIEKSIPGDADLHLQIYRICQEALTNVARHAQARNVTLRLTRPYRAMLELIIQDDGRGFKLEEAAARSSLGHPGIRERVNLLGGTLELSSSPNQGCRLRVKIPLEP